MSTAPSIHMSKWSEWSNTQVIRQWWYVYRLVLDRPAAHTTWHDELNALSKELEDRGVMSKPMPRKGAEDLADICDDFKKRQGVY